LADFLLGTATVKNTGKADITQLNAALKTTVEKIDQLRADIDSIVAEIK
jgi:cell division protein FtsB